MVCIVCPGPISDLLALVSAADDSYPLVLILSIVLFGSLFMAFLQEPLMLMGSGVSGVVALKVASTG